MRDRAVAFFVVVLGIIAAHTVPVAAAPAAAPAGPEAAPPLIEHEAPIIVETASLLIAGPDDESGAPRDNSSGPGGSPFSNPHGDPHSDPHAGHQVPAEIQEAMNEHAELLRASTSMVQTGPGGLPASNFAASFGGIAVTYNSGYSAPASVRSVVDAAVNQWDSALATNPSGPIVIEVFWSNLGNPSLLGYAGPDGMYFGGGLPTTSLYPAALANTLLGLDANGASRPEIQVVLNAELLANNRWYLGTTGTPPGSQIDLYSVVLHEIGHGLGFLGSATIPSGQSAPSLHSPPYVYDTVASHNGTAVTGAANQSAALRSGDVHIDISSSSTYELYAPSSWSQGSSFSHFDESSYPPGSPGALMTPMLSSGETARVLDSPTLGLMSRTGWPTTVKATTPTITSLSPSLTSIVTSWDQNLGHVGIAPDNYLVEAWRDGTTLQSSVTVSGAATSATLGSLSPGQNYTIRVTPTGTGGAGTPASDTVQLSTSGGPADPSDWPSFIRNVPLDSQINRLYQAYFLRLPEESGFGYWVDQRARWTPLLDISSAFASSPEFQTRYGALSNEAFVDLVYANVLNRLADAEGRAYWIGRLNQGTDRGEVMIGFAESPEYVGRTGTAPATSVTEARISRLYQAFFLRAADAGGLAYWGGQAANGVTLEAMASSFVQSSEFQTRYGALTDQQFVELVYNNVLSRSPDTDGLNYWVGQMNGGVDRGAVMIGFSESVEFIKSTGTIP